MINEKELIEYMEERRKLMHSLIGGKHLVFIEDVIECIKGFSKVDKWIPCSERLPLEEYERAKNERGKQAVYPVLVTCKELDFETNKEYKKVKRAFFFDYMGKETFYDKDIEKLDVVAWMPLPDPYIEKPDFLKKAFNMPDTAADSRGTWKDAMMRHFEKVE